MSMNAVPTQESIATKDRDECGDCASLPDGWPCADCYIHGEKSVTAEGY